MNPGPGAGVPVPPPHFCRDGAGVAPPPPGDDHQARPPASPPRAGYAQWRGRHRAAPPGAPRHQATYLDVGVPTHHYNNTYLLYTSAAGAVEPNVSLAAEIQWPAFDTLLVAGIGCRSRNTDSFLPGGTPSREGRASKSGGRARQIRGDYIVTADRDMIAGLRRPKPRLPLDRRRGRSTASSTLDFDRFRPVICADSRLPKPADS